ncbi:flavin reductase family protein [Actinoallomurus sp. CA-142502]|uniref:flavin reductase family protein n=1 Tax=Actinoallomurus sp. CA-142502 TaxID=3239885 RepID=UPI003D900929
MTLTRTTTGAVDEMIDPECFRSVLSHYPTGICAITAIDDGEPTGFVVGTFTSVSLEPPLVGFFPDKKSTTFPKVRRAGAFCANVLSAQDEELCRLFAAKGADRFASVRWRPGPTGSPILERATAWIDCELEQVHEVGDHLLVVGRVVDLATRSADEPPEPLIFHRGRFGSYAPNHATPK